MQLNFSQKTNNEKAHRIPEKVKTYMVHKFYFLPEYLDILRCFEYQDTIDQNPVRRVSIFNPYKAKEKNIFVKTRQDLTQHPELIEYEGHISKEGTVYIMEKRQPASRLKTSLWDHFQSDEPSGKAR